MIDFMHMSPLYFATRLRYTVNVLIFAGNTFNERGTFMYRWYFAGKALCAVHPTQRHLYRNSGQYACSVVAVLEYISLAQVIYYYIMIDRLGGLGSYLYWSCVPPY